VPLYIFFSTELAEMADQLLFSLFSLMRAAIIFVALVLIEINPSIKGKA